ncbi:FAD-dependent oxidoreductase [Lacrimispora sp. 210928-DFI.3.58]|uniref:FAD-dependent oxidoreductase n=1 Tax=Lacrimispora sp. 210928-DFI.3.58 TaxID=2883214 RepID=UPI001D060293|nr:FAD-dependent oxidoreductase [Lacrimispora sp. 210928-DFI.3.58]MCB7317863.1 FAD-dependent oxidoreductase [Lacrimispora sp. 210928-DFI.3.58]
MKFEKKYDVIVAGGGPAGVAAAIASARNGARTLLVERDGYLGGMATGASIPAFCTYTDGVETIIRGIGLEILEELKQHSWKSPFYDRKPGRLEEYDWLPIDSESLKLILDRLVTASGCDILFHTVLIDCNVENHKVKELLVHNKSGLQYLSASCVVDCTGDADLSAMAGCEMEYGDENDQVQGGTLCFKVANFDTDRFLEYAEKTGENGNLMKAVERAKENGDFPAGEVKVAGISLPARGMASFNFGHVFDWNPINGESITKAEIESRQKLPMLMNFIRSYVPGAEQAVLALSGPNIGVRESRRLRGRYILTGEDYMRRADFEDSIAYYSYPIDIHASNGADAEAAETGYQKNRYAPGESYGIPFRCLLPQTIDNLLVAGRTVSCDRMMQASLRVMPACFAMGQAAGTAAAMAAEQGICMSELDTDALRMRLFRQGAYLKGMKQEMSKM